MCWLCRGFSNPGNCLMQSELLRAPFSAPLALCSHVVNMRFCQRWLGNGMIMQPC